MEFKSFIKINSIISSHLTSLVDIDANATLRLIASLDKSRKLILSYLPNGRYIRAFDIKGTDKLNKLMLMANGYIVIVSELQSTDRSSIKTIIRVFCLNSNQISEIELTGQLHLWCRIELDSGFDGIALIMKDQQLIFLEIPTLKKLFETTLHRQIMAIHCIPQYLTLILIDVVGTVHYVELD